jgi:hypothetical protein
LPLIAPKAAAFFMAPPGPAAAAFRSAAPIGDPESDLVPSINAAAPAAA